MSKQISNSQLVKNFLTANYETTDKTRLAEDFGVRITKKSDGSFEFSTTYFYRSQNKTVRLVKDFSEYAAQQGVTVAVPIEDGISFQTNPWPKRSWASVKVTW